MDMVKHGRSRWLKELSRLVGTAKEGDILDRLAAMGRGSKLDAVLARGKPSPSGLLNIERNRLRRSEKSLLQEVIAQKENARAAETLMQEAEKARAAMAAEHASMSVEKARAIEMAAASEKVRRAEELARLEADRRTREASGLLSGAHERLAGAGAQMQDLGASRDRWRMGAAIGIPAAGAAGISPYVYDRAFNRKEDRPAGFRGLMERITHGLGAEKKAQAPLVKKAISAGVVRRALQNTLLGARSAGRGLLPREQQKVSAIMARLMNRDVGAQLRGHVPEARRSIMSYFAQGADPKAEEAFVRSLTGQKMKPEHAPFRLSAGEDPRRNMQLLPKEERWAVGSAEGRHGVTMRGAGEHAPSFEVETAPTGVSAITRMGDVTPEMHARHGGRIAGLMTRFTPVEEAMGRVTSRFAGNGAQPVRLISMNNAGSSTSGYLMSEGMLESLNMAKESPGYRVASAVYDRIAGKGATDRAVDKLANTLTTMVDPGRHTGTPEEYSRLMHRASKAVSGFTGYPVEFIPGGPANVKRHMEWLKHNDKGWATGKKTILNEFDLFKDIPEDWKTIMDDPFWASRRELLPDINLYGRRARAGIVGSDDLDKMKPGNFYDVNKINEADMMNKYSPGVMGRTEGIHDIGDVRGIIKHKDVGGTGGSLAMSDEARKLVDDAGKVVLKRLGGAGSHPTVMTGDELARTRNLIAAGGDLEPYSAMVQEAVERGLPMQPGELGLWDRLKFSPATYNQGFNPKTGPEYRVNMTRGAVDRILPTMVRTTVQMPGALGRAVGEYVPEHGTLKAQIAEALKDMPRAYREAPLAFDATLDPARKLKVFETNIHGFSGRDIAGLQLHPLDLIRLLSTTGYQPKGSLPYLLQKSPYALGGAGLASAALVGAGATSA